MFCLTGISVKIKSLQFSEKERGASKGTNILEQQKFQKKPTHVLLIDHLIKAQFWYITWFIPVALEMAETAFGILCASQG